MKKNLISIVILALLIVNIVLTSIMMFSVANTNRKTAALVNDIASAISLDLTAGEEASDKEPEAVPMADIATYTIADMTIQLQPTIDEESGKSNTHYIMTSIVLSMNMKNKDYKTYGADIANKEDLIKGEITEVIGQYTMEEASADTAGLSDAILNRIQTLYGSDFIFDVTLSNPLYQ